MQTAQNVKYDEIDARRIRETANGTRLLPAGGGRSLQDAIAHIRGTGGAVQEEQRADSIDGDRQRLIAWAQKSGRFKGWKEVQSYGKEVSAGQEHSVYDRGERVLKVTHDTPLFVADYLERHILHNVAFGDATEIEGVFVRPDSGRIGVVISQPFRVGYHPNFETVKKNLAAVGFACVGRSDSYRGYGIIISDVGSKNWIELPSGKIVAIDVRVFLDTSAS